MKLILDCKCQELNWHTFGAGNWNPYLIINSFISIQPYRPGLAGTRAQSCDWYGSGTLHPGQALGGSLPLLSPDFIINTFNIWLSYKPWKQEIGKIPDWPKRKAVAEFRLCVGHDSFGTHLHRIGIRPDPYCMLCSLREPIDWNHLGQLPHYIMGQSLSDTGRPGQTWWNIDFVFLLLLFL